MASWLLRLVVVVAVLGAAWGLLCYECSGCNDGQRGHPRDCSAIDSYCAKLVLGSRVEKGCSTGATCQIENMQKGFGSLISAFSSAITGEKTAPPNIPQVAHCCSTDFCNAAASPAVAALLPLLALATLAWARP